MAELANRVRPGIGGIEPYIAGLTDDELMRKFGLHRVIKLNANENALGPSPLAIEAVRKELQSLHHYPNGTSDMLREEIAHFHHVTEDQVLVGNGSDDIIKLISETFLNPGDEVIVPAPSFSQYGFGAAIMQASVRAVPLGPEYEYDVDALLAAVTDKTKLLYVCSPNNPTGTILRHDDAMRLLQGLPNDVLVVMDLAYNDYSEDASRVVDNEAILSDPRVIVLHTFSKLYGLAGLRVGYGLAHADVWQYVHRVREPFNVNRVAQRAAAAALHDEAHRLASVLHARESRIFYAKRAEELGLKLYPAEGNFVLLETGDAASTTKQLMERGVMVRAGFKGLPDSIRVTFGTEEENRVCMNELAQILGR